MDAAQIPLLLPIAYIFEHELWPGDQQENEISELNDIPRDMDTDDLSMSTAFGMTDVGRVRETNQDQFLIAQLNKSMLVKSTSLDLHHRSRLFGSVQGQLLLVADGMGGHAAGEKASSLAVDHLIGRLLNSVNWFFQVDEHCEQEFVNALKEMLQDAHTRILCEASKNSAQQGMGTTLTMAHLVWPRMYVVHAGDSRCYLIRGGEARQLTTDHTLARQLVEAGGLNPEDEAKSRWSNVLWNVLGGNRDGGLMAEVRKAELQSGDTIVLCSDGLHRYLDEETIAKVVSEEPDPRSVCRRLVQMANDEGGEDNITVVVCKPEATKTANDADALKEEAKTSPQDEPTVDEPNRDTTWLHDTLPLL